MKMKKFKTIYMIEVVRTLSKKYGFTHTHGSYDSLEEAMAHIKELVEVELINSDEHVDYKIRQRVVETDDKKTD